MHIIITDIGEKDSFYPIENIIGSVLQINKESISAHDSEWFSVTGNLIYTKSDYISFGVGDVISFYQIKYKEIEESIYKI